MRLFPLNYLLKKPLKYVRNSNTIGKPLATISKDSFCEIVTTYTGAEYAHTNRSALDLIKLGSYPISFFTDLLGKKVLDVGTGGGQFVLDLKKLKINAMGLDIVPHKNFKKQAEAFIVADAANTKLPEKSFDRIFSAWSVLSLGNDNTDFEIKVLSEMKRILKDDGIIRLGCVDIDKIKELAKLVDGLKIKRCDSCSDYLARGWAELVKV